jgi:hypothetical protein
MKDVGHSRLDVDHFGEYEQFYLWRIEESEEEEESAEQPEKTSEEITVRPTLESLELERLSRVQYTLTGAIINGREVGYKHLRQYYKQYLNRVIPNMREKYQHSIEMDQTEWEANKRMLYKQPKICACSHGR